jgi:hypothetical protein
MKRLNKIEWSVRILQCAMRYFVFHKFGIFSLLVFYKIEKVCLLKSHSKFTCKNLEIMSVHVGHVFGKHVSGISPSSLGSCLSIFMCFCSANRWYYQSTIEYEIARILWISKKYQRLNPRLQSELHNLISQSSSSERYDHLFFCMMHIMV